MTTSTEPNDPDRDDVPSCPFCDGIGEPIGSLGPVVHYRCRYCGITFHDHEETESDPN